MTLDIPREYEGVLDDAVASGAFATPQDALRHALAAFAKEHNAGRHGQPPSDSSPDTISQMPKEIDIEELARKQGVEPLADFRKLEASFWPADESVDAFIHAIREGRQDDGARTR